MRPGLLLAATLLVAACGTPDTGVLRVGIASSLAEAMPEIGARYETADLELSVAGSQVLVAQVREGAPLDVVVTADDESLSRLAGLGRLDGPPVRIAGNRLAIAVAPGNPLAIGGLDDLSTQLIVVLAAPEVPAGAYTKEMLERAGIDVEPDSLEPSVRSVLSKVELGEADAGIVYATDLGAARVTGVPIDDAVNVATSYYAAVVSGAADPRLARDFVGFLQGEDAGAVFQQLGFST